MSGERHEYYDARTCTCGEALKHNLTEHRAEVRAAGVSLPVPDPVKLDAFAHARIDALQREVAYALAEIKLAAMPPHPGIALNSEPWFHDYLVNFKVADDWAARGLQRSVAERHADVLAEATSHIPPPVRRDPMRERLHKIWMKLLHTLGLRDH